MSGQDLYEPVKWFPRYKLVKWKKKEKIAHALESISENLMIVSLQCLTDENNQTEMDDHYEAD